MREMYIYRCKINDNNNTLGIWCKFSIQSKVKQDD